MKGQFWSVLLALFLAMAVGTSGRTGHAAQEPAAEHAIFVLDTSLSEHPDRYRTNLQKVEKILAADKALKHFNVLTFDIAGRWLDRKGWLENNPAGRARAKKAFESVLLEGATDIGAALDRLARPEFPIPAEMPIRVFLLSDGNITWGESEVRSVAERFRSLCAFTVKLTCESAQAESANRALFNALEALPAPGTGPKTPAKAAFLRFLDKVDPQVKLLEGKNGEHVKLLLGALTAEEYDWPAPPLHDAIRLEKDVPQAYLQARQADRLKIATHVAEAKRRSDAGDPVGAVRALSSVAEIQPANADALRSTGYRLLDLKQPEAAARLFQRVQRFRPLEPHSYRDLARSLEDAGKFGLAAVHYEVVLAGTWNAKFTTSLKEVVLEEYAHMMRHAIRQKSVGNKLINLFGERLEGVDSKKLQADLRVTISWNTDDTDVDLWVIEPDGTKCFYGHRQTKNGGELTQDVTQGYGPERYQMIKARSGEYAIKVHYYSGPRNPQIAETHVNVVVRRNAGTPQEVSQRYTVILRNRNDLVDVCRMKFE